MIAIKLFPFQISLMNPCQSIFLFPLLGEGTGKGRDLALLGSSRTGAPLSPSPPDLVRAF